MTVSFQTLRKFGLAGAIALVASSAQAAVSTGPLPITGQHQIYDMMFVDVLADIAGFVDHLAMFATWTGLAAALFAGLWMLRNRAGQQIDSHAA